MTVKFHYTHTFHKYLVNFSISFFNLKETVLLLSDKSSSKNVFYFSIQYIMYAWDGRIYPRLSFQLSSLEGKFLQMSAFFYLNVCIWQRQCSFGETLKNNPHFPLHKGSRTKILRDPKVLGSKIQNNVIYQTNFTWHQNCHLFLFLKRILCSYVLHWKQRPISNLSLRLIKYSLL